jgi:dihydroorotase
LQTYVQVFDEEGALARFEAFASLNGARFHGLEPNRGTLTLVKKPGVAVAAVPIGEEDIVVFRGGETLPWSVGGTGS